MMDRRVFLKLTGFVAAAGALKALPVAAAERPQIAVRADQARDLTLVAPSSVPSSTRLAVREPGIYQISGRVRLDEPLVEISGINHTQRISWSGIDGPEGAVAGFTTFERFDRPGMTPEISIRGGQLEALSVVPVEFQ